MTHFIFHSRDNDVYKRLSGQINADYQINKWVQVGVTTSLEKRSSVSVSEGVTSVLGGMLSVAPILPYIYEDGQYPERVQRYLDQGKPLLRDPEGHVYGLAAVVAGSHNPAIMRERSENRSDGFNLRGTAYLNFTPIKGFTFTSRFGYRTGYSNNHTYAPECFISDKLTEVFSMGETLRNNFYYQWENFANYNFKVGNNNFTAMAGMSFQHSESNYATINADELTNYAPNFRYLSSVVSTSGLKVSGQPDESANLSFFGRIGWSYDNRYNIQASFRADAYDSSKLEKNHRWGYFPSVSAGWTISNEDWMQNLASAMELSSLKLRASWGINGNVNALGSYQYASTLTNLSSAGYNFGDGFINGVSPLQPGSGWWVPSTVIVPNPEVKWETSHQVDVGLDARFFSNRLSIALDWYNKNTMDLLTSTTPPANTGGTTMYVNAGKVNNTGFEVELDWKDSIGEFNYGISANAAFLKNTVVESIDIQKVKGTSIHTSYTVTYLDKGYPLWYIGAFQMEGIDQQTGAATYKDVNNDGKLDQDDQIYSGKGIPDMTYGFTINLAYKGFDFIVNAAGIQGVDRLFCVFRGDNPETNKPKSFYDRTWKNPQSTGYSLPKPSSADTYLPASTAMIFDGSFMKIKQMQLGYNLPKSLVSKLSLSNIRLYVSLDDWFTFTKYPGLDPETTGSGSRLAVDSGAYPISKKTVFGVNVAF